MLILNIIMFQFIVSVQFFFFFHILIGKLSKVLFRKFHHFWRCRMYLPICLHTWLSILPAVITKSLDIHAGTFFFSPSWKRLQVIYESVSC